MSSLDLVAVAREVLKEGKGRAELIRRVPGTTIWAARRALETARLGDPELADAKKLAADPIVRSKAIQILRKGTTVDDLAEELGVTDAVLDTILGTIEANGYPIARRGPGLVIERSNADIVMPLFKLNRANQQSGHVLTLGFITDTHLCSKFQRLDVLDYAYDIFEERGIKTVLHAGNIVDGESKVNTHDLLVHGIAEQAHYVIEHYPAKKGITTYYIDGDDHEGWWFQREGIEFGRYLMFEALAAGRDDLKYMGYMENDVEMVPGNKKTVIRIVHPGGGSSYAHSYTAQKIVESYTPGEKPSILLIGHYHKANFGVIRGVHCIQGGCTQDQSTFMRKKRLEAHVGFWILTVELDSNGAVSRFLPEFFNFFDKGYVIKRDGIVL